uniref:Conotoxin Ama1251 n=1 Tax=Conus amadis TaxID=198732 RepID=T1251_CONAA|nr:RecName: Full=Conotoxin Ama1251 [Conus amadis]
DSCCIEQHCCD